MNDIPNPFEEVAKQKRGRPATKRPVGESSKPKAQVGSTTRKPVGMRKRESTATRNGFYRRWVNDTEDRIQMFEEGGYVSVKDDSGNPKTKRVGGGRTAILMEIDQDLYNQDQQAKYAKWNHDCQERLQPRDGAGYYKPKSKM